MQTCANDSIVIRLPKEHQLTHQIGSVIHGLSGVTVKQKVQLAVNVWCDCRAEGATGGDCLV